MAAEGRMGDVYLATGVWERMRGLLGTSGFSGQLLLVPCHDVHTFCMRYPIDVAFLDERGVIVKALRCLEPGRRVRCKGACAVLERQSDAASEWYREGERVIITARPKGCGSTEGKGMKDDEMPNMRINVL